MYLLHPPRSICYIRWCWRFPCRNFVTVCYSLSTSKTCGSCSHFPALCLCFVLVLPVRTLSWRFLFSYPVVVSEPRPHFLTPPGGLLVHSPFFRFLLSCLHSVHAVLLYYLSRISSNTASCGLFMLPLHVSFCS